MRHDTPTRPTTRSHLTPIAAGLILVTAVIIGTLVFRSPSAAGSSFSGADGPGVHRAVPRSASSSAPSVDHVPRGDGSATEGEGSVTEDDGALPDGVTVFDGGYPGIGNLDPDLLRALRDAATDAAHDGIGISVNSGWRSPKYQDQLLREAVAKYGSAQEAARWVATADTSAHVSGDAVDIGSVDATAWLADHGAEYGLCQIYRNESWHFELRLEAIDGGCPPEYADPANDPSLGH